MTGRQVEGECVKLVRSGNSCHHVRDSEPLHLVTLRPRLEDADWSAAHTRARRENLIHGFIHEQQHDADVQQFGAWTRSKVASTIRDADTTCGK